MSPLTPHDHSAPSNTNGRQRTEMTSFAPGGSAVHESDDGAADFAAVRRRLFGIAYRMVGSWTEAEDIVQDVWIRWQGYDRTTVLNPTAFLVTTTARLAINATQSARVRYESYVGEWVHEPADSSVDPPSRIVQIGGVGARHPGPAGAAFSGRAGRLRAARGLRLSVREDRRAPARE